MIKYSFRPATLIVILLTVMFYLSNDVDADVLNMDLGLLSGTASGEGVIGAPSDVWNSSVGLGASTTTLVRSTGRATAIKFSFDNVAGGSEDSVSFGADPFGQDYLGLQDDDAAVFNFGLGDVGVYKKFSIFTDDFSAPDGLTVGENYDLYLVGSGKKSNVGSTFALVSDVAGAASFQVGAENTGQTFDGSYNEGTNLTKFRNVRPTALSGGRLGFEIYFFGTDQADIDDDGIVNGSTVGSAEQEFAFNGFQMTLPPSTVPEPSSWGALLGLLACCCRRRKSPVRA